MSSFRSAIVVTAQSTYPVSPQVDLTSLFEPTGYSVTVIGNGSADAVVAYSLDGVNDHGVITEGTSTASKSFAERARRVWVRKVSGTGAISVDVEAKN